MRTPGRWAALAILAMLVGCGTPAEGAEGPPTALTVEMLPGGAQDEALYRITWGPPAVGARQRAIERYEVRVDLAGAPVYTRTDVLHPQVSDTVPLPFPEVDETEGPYTAHVRAVDTGGLESEWTSSTAWSITGTWRAPSPPGDVEVDSIPPEVVSVRIIPDSLSMLVGEEFQLCAYAEMSDGSFLMSPDLPECQARLVESFSTDELQWRQSAWNPAPTGGTVRVRYWPRVVAVEPGHQPKICSARHYASGRLDFADGCLEEAIRWATGERPHPVSTTRYAMADRERP